jgi:N-acetylglucosaminyldiphosphoundecaprenol N-acetyl-beta-D-mannosaminyltransferase
VGLSTPKQERFMAEYLPKLDAKVMVGVGAAFDIHTGRAKDSPDWVKNAGLQWFHRLLQEPSRLWKRYLINNPVFMYKMTSQLLGLTKYESL